MVLPDGPAWDTGLTDPHSEFGSVVPKCSFVRGWIEKHEEYGDLVASPSR